MRAIKQKSGLAPKIAELKKNAIMVRNYPSNRSGPKVADDAFHMRMIQQDPESNAPQRKGE
jgi:hypothetical protein